MRFHGHRHRPSFHHPRYPGRLILDWARAAEQAGFSSLGTLDRLVYANLETVPALAAVAAVTERIKLTTAILIGPYRGNGALLAKQLATVNAIAGGGCKSASPSAAAPTTSRQPGLRSPNGAALSTPSLPNFRRSGHSSPADMPGRSARPPYNLAGRRC